MANIQPEITSFKTAVYGEDVRDAMVSLANKLNNESSSSASTVAEYNARLTAAENKNTAQDVSIAELTKQNNISMQEATAYVSINNGLILMWYRLIHIQKQ